MSDLREWLERIGGKIPGYAGYAERERRRDADKLQREHLADRLRAVKAPLTEAVREMTDGGRLFEVGPVERVVKKVDQAENRVRFASYGYSGFFDANRVEAEQLESLYRFDLALVEKFEEIERLAREFRAGVGGGAKASVAEVERAVDEFNQTFDRRHEAINSFGRGDEQSGGGAPLFGAR
ncbi:MAG TPA: hypothetical protein VGV38_07315 [Pyrinomonadaceae bacterium]|nr:hypothetical protein [Pyrinomonadaceae bacterium]